MADDPEKTAETDPDPETVARLNRIVTLTQNGRATWFGYLGALAFSALTLLSVEDKDFFTADASTQLPIVNFAVPTTAFFSAGALLIALTYGYLHVFLEKLWRELGRVEPRINGDPVADHIHPWIVSDFALRLRRWLRDSERGDRVPIAWTPLGIVSNTASFLMCWLSGPIVMAWFWLRSMPAHEPELTIWLAILLSSTIATCIASLTTLRRRMRIRLNRRHLRWRRSQKRPVERQNALWWDLGKRRRIESHRQTGRDLKYRDFALLAALLVILVPHSAYRSASGLFGPWSPDSPSQPWPALIWHPLSTTRASLEEQNITELPRDWVSFQSAREEYFLEWCARANRPDVACTDPIPEASPIGPQHPFVEEWSSRRATYLRVLRKPLLENRNFRNAEMRQIFMPGVVQPGVQMERAVLIEAQMERAVLVDAQMQEADLSGAQMQGAVLSTAQMKRAVLRAAQMQGANLRRAQMQEADLSRAKMQGADLRRAQMQRAILRAAQMQGADLRRAQMQEADLRRAEMNGAVLRRAQTQGADLRGAQMQGADLRRAQMQDADLRRSQTQGADLRGAQMQRADLRWAQIQEADLRRAQMQEADLRRAQMQKADLRRAQMQEADLSRAQMKGAVLRRAQMQGADLFEAQMQGAILWEAQMQGAGLRLAEMKGADLRRAQMQGADLSLAQMQEAVLRRAQMQGADLRRAQMQGADLRRAQMQGADLSYSLLAGSAETSAALRLTNLIAATNAGGAIRFVNFTEAALAFTDFRNSFADGSVVTPPGFRRPCQWLTRLAQDDTEFFGIWRGWLEAGPRPQLWELLAPEGFADIPPIPPAKGCAWVEGVPMPMGP